MLQLIAYVLLGGAILNLGTESGELPAQAPQQLRINGPITAGGAAKPLDPPAGEQILRSAKLQDSRDMRIIIELVADYTDPVRQYPLLGAAQRHVTHYHVTISSRRGVREFSLDHQHLHRTAQ